MWQSHSAHTLISPFETPANIICETINPAPLLRMFFGGRRHGDDFRLLGNAECFSPSSLWARVCVWCATQRRRKTPFVLYNCMNDEYVLLLPGDDFLCWGDAAVTRKTRKGDGPRRPRTDSDSASPDSNFKRDF
jgi:hypothetical protein